MATYATVVTGLMVTAGAWAQDTHVSSTTKATGPARVTTDVQSATVEFVSGDDLVLKTADGQVRHIVVPPDARATTADGREITINEVKPGMTLTRTITTTTTPKTVTDVRTIEGRVWHVNPPSTVILRFPDGTNRQYRVPSGQMFNVDGQMRDVFHLRRGMNISATVVTETPMTVSSQSHEVTASAPPLPPPQPNVQTVLLIAVPTPATQTAASESASSSNSAPVQTARASLPKTASELPLIGLIGLVLLMAGLTWKKLSA